MREPTVIFDIDGTLANCDHRKHHILKKPKDWDSFFASMILDRLNAGVCSIYKEFLYNDAFKVIVLTGRPQKYKERTLSWFYSHGLIYGNDVAKDSFFFRPDGDRRDDHIVKKEIYEKKIEPKYDVFFVIEDRTRIVKMWRSLGLTCLQCADGNF